MNVIRYVFSVLHTLVWILTYCVIQLNVKNLQQETIQIQLLN